MERGWLFYLLFGAGVVLVPGIVERCLQGRIADWLRATLATLAAILVGVILVLVAGPLGL